MRLDPPRSNSSSFYNPGAARSIGTVGLLLGVFALLLAACSGGGGGGGSGDGGGGAGTGAVSIFLTDAPSDEFEQPGKRCVL